MHVKNSEFQIAALGPEKSSNVSDVCRARACYLNSNVGVKNNSSMLLESSCSEVENRKAEVSFSAR